MNSDWAWSGEEMYKMVAASAPIPSDARQAEFGPIAIPWEEKYVHGEVSFEDCRDNIYKEVLDIIQEKDAGTK